MAGIGRRIRYYLIGVVLGTFVVYFMFGNRTDIRCDYLPNARVLKNLRSKELKFSATATCQRECLRLDSLDVNQLLAAGAIIFSESEPRKEPCGEYQIITRLPDEREIVARVQNCDSTVTMLTLQHEGTECTCD